MRTHFFALGFLLFFLTVFLTGCDSSSSDYFFEKPSSLTTINGMKCSNGDISYMGLVIDNTFKYGARIMKISGCSAEIDKDFKDKKDGKTGIYVNGEGNSIDHVVINNELIIAVTSSGYTEYEHWKEKTDKNILELHKGRIVLRKLGVDLKHDSLFDRSFILDFYPLIVRSYKQKGFFFSGSNFGKNYIGFVDVEGKGKFIEVDFYTDKIAVAEDNVFAFDKKNGEIYSVTTDLKTELIKSDEVFKNGGIEGIRGDRIVLFYGNKMYVFNKDIKLIKKVEMPHGFIISAITSSNYSDTYEYRGFSSKEMTDFVKIYENEEDNSEESDNENISDDVEHSDEDVSDSDISIEEFDALKGDVLWIASKNGNVMAYDLENSSWLAMKYSESEQSSNPVYFNEMRPYIDSTYITFPKHGKTDSTNVPFISNIYSIRGIPYSMTYKLVYEGIMEGTSSSNGAMNKEQTLIKDLTADFNNYGIKPGSDSVIFLNRINSNKCMIPWNENAVFEITEVVSSNELGVNVEKYGDQIENCYGTPFSYGIFSKNRYSVSRENYSGVEFAGIGAELASDYHGDDFSFLDEFVGISIKRKTDEVITEKETAFHIKVNPGVPFIGFGTNDVFTVMTNPSSDRILMFSPLTRRIIEYNFYQNKIVKIYK